MCIYFIDYRTLYIQCILFSFFLSQEINRTAFIDCGLRQKPRPCQLSEAHNISLGITQISFSNHIFFIISFFAKVIILLSVVLLPTNLTILLLKCQTITIPSSKGDCTAHNNLEHMITITCLDGKDGNAIIPNNCNRKGDYSK